MDATVNRIERLSVLDRAVTQVNTRNESLSTVADPRWDPIIIDLGPRPSRDLALIQSIRRHSHAPPLVLSGQNGVNQQVAALDLRADHHVSRPFAIEEVLGRLRATARRGGTARSTAVATISDVQIHLAAKTAVQRSGERIRLTPIGWQLLAHLVGRPGRLVSGPAPRTAARRVREHTDASHLRSYIARLRQKLEDEPESPATSSPSAARVTPSSPEQHH
jgi:two-component system KDP operon response regulator KdpE